MMRKKGGQEGGKWAQKAVGRKKAGTKKEKAPPDDPNNGHPCPKDALPLQESLRFLQKEVAAGHVGLAGHTAFLVAAGASARFRQVVSAVEQPGQLARPRVSPLPMPDDERDGV